MDAVSLNRVYDYEVSRSDLTSPEHSLRVSLARTGKKKFAQAIFFSWPNLEIAARNLAGLLSHHYPNKSGEGFLLDEALAAACDVYEETVETTNFTRRMGLFLKTMLDVTADNLLQWDTHGMLDGGTTVAWPVGSLALQDWVKRRSIDKVIFTKRQTAPTVVECTAARISFASCVMTYHDVLHMLRTEMQD